MNSRVLIADDQPEICRLLELTLEPLGVDILSAGDSDTALRLAHEHRPEVAVLDIMMPGSFDGLEVCRRIKNTRSLAHCLVILLTARGQRNDVDAGNAAGADVYMVKPFSPLQLADLVESALDSLRDG